MLCIRWPITCVCLGEGPPTSVHACAPIHSHDAIYGLGIQFDASIVGDDLTHGEELDGTLPIPRGRIVFVPGRSFERCGWERFF